MSFRKQSRDMLRREQSLSTSEAACLCGVHYSTLRRWIRDGLIPAYETPGGHLRIHQEDMGSFLASRRIQGARADDSHIRLLVVDDDNALRDTIVNFFEKDSRFEVREAADGFSAGRLMAEFQPDVITLDLLMPGMDGFSVCRNIRDSKRSRHTRIVVLTGYGTEDNFQRARECGADICLAKPVELDDLCEAILNVLGKANPAAAASISRYGR